MSKRKNKPGRDTEQDATIAGVRAEIKSVRGDIVALRRVVWSLWAVGQAILMALKGCV